MRLPGALYSQIFILICFLGMGGDLVDHVVELGTSGGSETLSMGFLKKPELFESDYRISTGNLEVELIASLLVLLI